MFVSEKHIIEDSYVKNKFLHQTMLIHKRSYKEKYREYFFLFVTHNIYSIY